MLVLALTVFAASPVAHGCLHADDGHHPEDDGCAVMLFAAGVAAPLDPIVIPVPVAANREAPPVGATEIFLVTPRYLRQPERGPPVTVVV
jgi:hypothetical protein